ncbi:hypothetical protein H0Z60_09015 [Ectothiorhodospiraceae bacterium WFHF3C12]|nr:hypothetical protein [Ectothiorhodospiraceae bacterium WFHF3C12]
MSSAVSAQNWEWQSNAVDLTPEAATSGLQLQSPFSESLHFRLGLATSRFDNYVAGTEVSNARPAAAEPIAGALLDYHVNRWGLRFTGGALYSTASREGSFMSAYDVAEVDPSHGLFDGGHINAYESGYAQDQVLPYFGLGWGQAFGTEQRLQLKMDFGIAFRGVTNLDGTADGSDPPAGTARTLDTYRLEDELGWESQFESLRYSFSAGVRYRF